MRNAKCSEDAQDGMEQVQVLVKRSACNQDGSPTVLRCSPAFALAHFV